MLNIQSYIVQIRDKDCKHLGYVDIDKNGKVSLVDNFSIAHVFTSMKDIVANKNKYMSAYPNCHYDIHNLGREKKIVRMK